MQAWSVHLLNSDATLKKFWYKLQSENCLKDNIYACYAIIFCRIFFFDCKFKKVQFKVITEHKSYLKHQQVTNSFFPNDMQLHSKPDSLQILLFTVILRVVWTEVYHTTMALTNEWGKGHGLTEIITRKANQTRCHYQEKSRGRYQLRYYATQDGCWP